MVHRCPICQDRIESEEISALKCGHTFHGHCILNWLNKSNVSHFCPVCRKTNYPGDVIGPLFFDEGRDSVLLTAPPNLSNPLIDRIEFLESELAKAMKEKEEALSANENVVRESQQQAAEMRERIFVLEMSETDQQAQIVSLTPFVEASATQSRKIKELEREMEELQTNHNDLRVQHRLMSNRNNTLQSIIESIERSRDFWRSQAAGGANSIPTSSTSNDDHHSLNSAIAGNSQENNVRSQLRPPPTGFSTPAQRRSNLDNPIAPNQQPWYIRSPLTNWMFPSIRIGDEPIPRLSFDE